jgi:phosphoglycolate phosphatase
MANVKFGTRVFETELIIFDKDGTLTDFSTSWIPLFKKRVEIIIELAGLAEKSRALERQLSQAFGMEGNKVDPYGPYPYTTPWEDEVIITTVLYRHGMHWHKAKEIAKRGIEEAEKLFDRARVTKLHPGVREILEGLKNRGGIKLSVATSDVHSITVETLRNCGIDSLLDYIVCADMVEREKPDPEMVEKTLDALGVGREKTVLVGDSIVDMEMGKRARLGLVAGVLEGGVADEKALSRNADLIIGSVRDITPVG